MSAKDSATLSVPSWAPEEFKLAHDNETVCIERLANDQFGALLSFHVVGSIQRLHATLRVLVRSIMIKDTEL